MDKTTIFIIASFLIIVAVDIWLAVDDVQANTISARLRFWGRVWKPSRLLLTFGLGLLTGHLYWT